MYLKFSFHISK